MGLCNGLEVSYRSPGSWRERAANKCSYALQWLVVLPLEIVAATFTIRYWHTSVPDLVWVAIFLVTIITINLFGVKGYGEFEFVLAVIKVAAIIGFIILGV